MAAGEARQSGFDCEIEALEQENEALRRCLKEQTKEMDQKLEPVLPSLPVEFTMNDFDRYKKNKRAWYSPPFYTHPQGYKLSLKVIPNIRGDPTAMYVGAFLMRGEFDHLLKWPFEGSIALEMLNQLEDSEHFKFRAVFIGTQRAYRLRDSDRAERGRGNDVLYEKMNYNPTKHCQYLKDNCLAFEWPNSLIETWYSCNDNVLPWSLACVCVRLSSQWPTLSVTRNTMIGGSLRHSTPMQKVTGCAWLCSLMATGVHTLLSLSTWCGDCSIIRSSGPFKVSLPSNCWTSEEVERIMNSNLSLHLMTVLIE